MKGSPEILLSKEGTTQGDPLAMLMYGIGMLPLNKELSEILILAIQIWYADDSGCVGRLKEIRKWFDLLMEKGLKYGYFPEPSKCVLIIKEGFEDLAREYFGHLGVEIVYASRYLGGFIGREGEVRKFIEAKVEMWKRCLNLMSKAATKYPQAVYGAFTKSLQSEWTFLQRVVSGFDDVYRILKVEMQCSLIPALFGREIHDRDRFV